MGHSIRLAILALTVAAFIPVSVGLASGFQEDFENDTPGGFPTPPWVPVKTRLIGSDAGVPSTVVIDTIDPFGNPTQAAQIVNAKGTTSAGALVEIETAAQMSFVTNFRIDQYGDAPGIHWCGVGFFQDGPQADLNGNPQAVVYSYFPDNHFRLFIHNNAQPPGTADVPLNGPTIVLGKWYRIEFSVNTTTGIYDIKIYNADTGTLFTQRTVNISSIWQPANGQYDAFVLLKGPDPLTGTRGTVASIDDFSTTSAITCPVSSGYVNAFLACQAGPNAGATPAECLTADLNHDGNVDLVDFGQLQTMFAPCNAGR